MENLTNLKLSISYGTTAQNVVRDFYTPCLGRSTLYRRGVGYFSSHGLAVAAQGIAHLIANGGRIQLIASPILAEEDVDAINRGYRSRLDVLQDSAVKYLAETANRLVNDRLEGLAWLIANELMDVKLALPINDAGRITCGIYHEKLGIFSDSADNHIAFVGSSNETVGGLVDNIESIEAFWSWDDPHRRVPPKIRHFEALWNDSLKNVQVVEFTHAARDLLKKYRPSKPPRRDPLDDSAPMRGTPSMPANLQLRDYQKQLRDSWFQSDGRGILKMATGTGKTITALSIILRLAQAAHLQVVVAVCPFRHLVTQWAKECESFGMQPILAFENRTLWHNRLSNALYNINRDATAFLTVITTNATFSSAAFQKLLQYFPSKSMIVVDEVHNMGAEGVRNKLPQSISLRLGLSATPERWFDETGTSAIADYFGPTLQPELTLADALRRGALVSYRYYPVLVSLTEDESEEYRRLSAAIARLWNTDAGPEFIDERVGALLVRRARLLATAQQKMERLREIMGARLGATHVLFYCGDGTVSNPISTEEQRQVDAVCQLLGRDLGFRVNTYTAGETVSQRESLQKRFEVGELQGLVAIRCLDEGVDIPLVRTAVILASSSNPRQFIQRRGRLLRRAPGKTSADILDMIVVPPKECTSFTLERSLLRKELIRFREFADLARNVGEARAAVFELQKAYDLTDI